MTVPDSAYYGVQTARALANFPVSGLPAHPELIRGYLLVKKAAVLANLELGVLDRELGSAILQAAEDVLVGRFLDQFKVDAYQAGAGTSFNMNVNEVLANRALELLGRQRGDYGFLSPNDHVNLGQSSNDTYPTAAHIAVILAAEGLLDAIEELALVFRRKGDEFRSIAKTGRTHLMDALPVTLGDEFRAYAGALERAAQRVEQRRNDLRELPIGGTAVGTGIGSHPLFRNRVIAHLSELCATEFTPARDRFEALQSRALLAAFSSSLKELALELIRIANDLRLLASGPFAGLAEIELPAVQPGSSIMPGKVNPSLAECLDMVCFQVVGNDTAVALATQAGQLELNVMAPVISWNVLQSVTLLVNFLPVFGVNCVEGIRADEERCRSFLRLSPALATLLVPKIGYRRAAELAREAVARKQSVLDLAKEQGILDSEEVRKLSDPGRMTGEKS
jgi:aspartate ammonia-lyase